MTACYKFTTLRYTSLIPYIERRAKEWWSTLPNGDRYPYHKMDWEEIPPKARETIMGLWIDDLEGVGFSKVKVNAT